ncbi:Predicted arabinose efflux permease, MFS family [Arthrobacter sp. 9V]|uniref:MFS transporter n=1 Tax=Arthrobacter sp. 9V TaxID=2653132 RepID=UPI0012EFA35C|nr:MFS transporter [Arthrobacter sp. 9V]VXA98877.1 Predicted arabinose efflux permease, MFS family [Arthrobacter sp. 9V]
MTSSTPTKSSFIGLSVVFAAFFFAAGAPTPLLSLRQQEWGFSAATLSIAFSMYAIGLLAALLIGGSLSDHLGRRPVMIIALYGELLSMAIFILAPNILWVIAARALQGLATGLATSAFNAAITEHAPSHRKKLAGGLTGASVAGGLGIGALVTGAAVQFTPDANTLIFAILAAVMIIALVYVSFTAETVTPRPGAFRSLVPRLGLPASIRPEFAAGLPIHIAGWMFPALFLGLSPALLRLQFGLEGGLIAGFTAFLGPFSAAAAGFYFTRHPARHSTLAGAALILAGIVVVLVGISTPWLPAIWIGAVLGGIGFGGSFGGQLRLMTPLVEPHQRAGVFASIYTAAYLAFSIPVVIAGLLVPAWGLVPTLEAYAATLLAFAALGAAIQGLRLRRDAAAVN